MTIANGMGRFLEKLAERSRYNRREEHSKIMTIIIERTITAIGESRGFTLPAEVLEDLGLQVGDQVQLVKTEQGYLLQPCDSNFDQAMAIYQAESARYGDVYKALADG